MWRLSRLPTSSAVKGKSVAGFPSRFSFFPARIHHAIPPIDSHTHSFIHSFIHSGLFWLLREPLQFRFWLFVYGSNFISFPDIEPKQLSPRKVASVTFGSFIKFSKSHLVLSRSFFVPWKSKRLFLPPALVFFQPFL